MWPLWPHGGRFCPSGCIIAATICLFFTDSWLNKPARGGCWRWHSYRLTGRQWNRITLSDQPEINRFWFDPGLTVIRWSHPLNCPNHKCSPGTFLEVCSPFEGPTLWQWGSPLSSGSGRCGWTSRQRWMKWFQRRRSEWRDPLALQSLWGQRRTKSSYFLTELTHRSTTGGRCLKEMSTRQSFNHLQQENTKQKLFRLVGAVGHDNPWVRGSLLQLHLFIVLFLCVCREAAVGQHAV